MVTYNANIFINSAIASQPTLLQQPAGGWGNWLGLSTTPPDESIQSGTAIYTFTAADLLKLQDSNSITDETYVYFKSRVLNDTKKAISQTQTSGDYSPLTAGRIFRALTALESLRLISRFSIDSVSISWIKISTAIAEARIRSDWAKKIMDDVTYVWEVLNLLRGSATSQTVNVTELWANWSITPLMLGDALNSLQSRLVITTYINSVSIQWFTPLLGAAVSYAEMRSLYNRAIIGETLYIYVAARSLKGTTASQTIDPVFLEKNYAITPTRLFVVMVRLLDRTFVSALDVTTVTIQWLDPIPTMHAGRVKQTERTLFKDAGLMMYAIACSNSNTINIDNLVAQWKIASAKEDVHRLGLKLLSRLIENDVLLVSLPQFSVTWV